MPLENCFILHGDQLVINAGAVLKLIVGPVGELKVIRLFYSHNRLIINLLKLKPALMHR